MTKPKPIVANKRDVERRKAKAKLDGQIASGEVVVLPSHPYRDPLHSDPHKGQVWRGECNAPGCAARHAVFFHVAALGLYCSTCAYTINRDAVGDPCIRVSDKPTMTKMDELRTSNGVQNLMQETSA